MPMNESVIGFCHQFLVDALGGLGIFGRLGVRPQLEAY